MIYTDKDVIKIIAEMTGASIERATEVFLFNKDNYPAPTNLGELIECPYKNSHSFLLPNRPGIIESIVDSTLGNGYKGTEITLTEVLDEIEEMRIDYSDCSEEDKAELEEQISEAERWLVEHRFGSMCVDW